MAFKGKLVHPTGLQQIPVFNSLGWQPTPDPTTDFCGFPEPLANQLSGAFLSESPPSGAA